MKTYNFDLVAVHSVSVQANSLKEAENLAIQLGKSCDFSYWSIETDLTNEEE